MQQVFITIILLITTIVFLYSTLRASRLIIQLKQQMYIPPHWSGRINVKELRIAYNMTKDPILQKQLSQAISLLRISKAIVYVSFILVVLIILFWK